MDIHLAYFLDLRIRLRGRAEAVALIDRCLAIIARAQTAGPAELAQLDREVQDLRQALVARFGPKPPLSVQ